MCNNSYLNCYVRGVHRFTCSIFFSTYRSFMETRIVTLLWPMNCFLPSKYSTLGFVLLLGSIIYQWEWSSTVVKVLQVKPCNSSNLFITCTLYTVIFNWVTYGIRDCSGFCLHETSLVDYSWKLVRLLCWSDLKLKNQSRPTCSYLPAFEAVCLFYF